MGRPFLHDWALDPDEAIRLQNHLREQLVLSWDGRPVTTIGGVDVDIEGERARAAIVVFRYPDLIPLASVTAEAPLVFPYIPGLLAFREGPAVLAAWEKLPLEPDVLLFDGQGIAHPRGCGIAAHMGLWLQKPAIGVAKSRLYGRHAEVGLRFGDYSELRDEREPDRIIGAALRTREKSNPLYISPGHLIDLVQVLAFVLACCRGYRLPEPTRWAHKVGAGAPLPIDCRCKASASPAQREHPGLRRRAERLPGVGIHRRSAK
jgi:deoxyribonuclease V